MKTETENPFALLPLRYSYTMRQTTQGRYCTLTADREAVALKIGAQNGALSSDELWQPSALEMLCEPGVRIELRDNWAASIEYVEGLDEIYPGVSEDKLRAMGFGSDLDRASICREMLSRGISCLERAQVVYGVVTPEAAR